MRFDIRAIPPEEPPRRSSSPIGFDMRALGESKGDPWNVPQPNKAGFSLQRAQTLIGQICTADKVSCVLTSTLNAWIMRGSLEPAEALAIQTEVVNNPQYDQYWAGAYSTRQRGWTAMWQNTAQIATEITNKRMPIAAKSPQLLSELLETGYAAVLTGPLNGPGDPNAHARLAFMLDGQPQPFVHDPLTMRLAQRPMDEILALHDAGYLPVV